MSAQGAEPTLWEKWDLHRQGCPDCIAASTLRPGTWPKEGQMCLVGGVLYCTWQNALSEAQEQDEADADHNRE